MINEILESNLSKLDLLYRTILESEAAPEIMKKYRDQRVTPTYLYLILERFLKGSRTGTYLSPASWLKKRSVFFLDKHAAHKNALIEAGENPDEVDEKAVDLTLSEIYQEIEEAKDKLRRENPTLSEDEITSKVNRAMPLHVNLPTWTDMSVDSQQVGDQEVFIGTSRTTKSAGVPLPELIAQSKEDKSLKDSYLESMRSLVRVHDAAPTWHDPNISKMVIFNDGSSIPPRTRFKLDKLRQRVKDVSQEIERYAASDDPAERAKVTYKEGELRYLRSQISGTSVGVWRPDDLNELVYGSVDPIDPAKVDASKYEDLPGLIPNLYYRIGGSESRTKRIEAFGVEVGQEKSGSRSMGTSYIDDLIFNVGKKRKTPEEKEAEVENLERMRREWREHKGDLRKISSDLYQIVVKYIIDNLPRHKVGADDLSRLKGIIPETGQPEITIGNTKYTKRKSGWDEGKSISSPSNKLNDLQNLSAIQDVNVLSQYNTGSVLKRISIAQMIAEAVDKSIYQWVLNKVGDSIYKVADPSNAGVLNIGSDPGVVNHFLCSIDQVESRYGLGARMSWYLIPFVDTHKSKANEYFTRTESITGASKEFRDLNRPIKFEDFRKWKPGVLDYESKTIIRDRSGHPIRITGEGFDYYMNLAIYVAAEEGKIDTDELYSNSVEIDALAEDLKSVIEDLQNNYQNIEALEDQVKQVVGDEAALVRINTELAKIKVAHKRLEKHKSEIEKKIGELEKHTNDSWGVVFDLAKQLQQLGPKALERIENRRSGRGSFDEDAFESWLSKSGKSKELESAQEAYAKADDKEAAELELQEVRNRLEKEFMAQTSDQEAAMPTKEVEELIRNLSEPYADYSHEKLAQIATERINSDKPESEWQQITPEQVKLVMGSEGVQRRHGNIVSFMVNALKEVARSSSAGDSSVAESMRQLLENDDAKFFVSAITEMVTAMIELSIIQSSQTTMFGGGGLKTDMSYKDEHGALRLPPGWDSGELYGQRSNPYEMIRQKQQMIEHMQEEIDSGNLVGEEVEAKKQEIKKQESIIEEYRRKMLDNPNVRKLADRAHAVAGPSNPFLPRNREYFNKLIKKMEAHFAGEEVKWETYVDKETGQEISDLDMMEFLHKHTPLMQSMGMNVARVAGRYLVPIRRSIDVLDVAGQPPSNSKNITDLGAMNSSNAVSGLLGMIGAKNYLHSLEEIFEKNGIDKALENISVPTRIVPYLAMELALWSNGSKMQGGLDTDGASLTREFVKNKLFEYLSVAKVPQHKINRVTDLIVDQMVKLSAPTEQDVEISKNLYHSTMPLFSDILNGTETLANYANLPYNPSDMQIISDLVESIKKMRDGEKVEDIEKRIEDFINFSNDLVVDKDSEEVFADCLEDLGDIDRLDNLNYLIEKFQYLEAMFGEADDNIKDDVAKQMETVSKEIQKISSELEKRDIIIDVSDKLSALVSIANYRDRTRNRLESRIDRYKDVPGVSGEKLDSIAGKLHQFKNVVNASFTYHQARSRADRATNPEEKAEAEAEQKAAYTEIAGSMDALKLSVGESGGSSLVHHLTTGELDEFADEYRERQDLYDRIIVTRNRIIGGSNQEEMKEQFKSIYRKLIEMTKYYNKKPEDIATELLERAAQFKEGIRFRGEKRRRAEKAFGGIETEVMVKIPGGGESVRAAIYPRENVIGKLEKILSSGVVELEASMLRPISFVKDKTDIHPEYGKTSIILKYKSPDLSIEDEMSIIRDQELNIEDHEKIIDYLNTNDAVSVLINFE